MPGLVRHQFGGVLLQAPEKLADWCSCLQRMPRVKASKSPFPPVVHGSPVVSVRITAELQSQLKTMAMGRGETLSDTTRWLIEQGLSLEVKAV